MYSIYIMKKILIICLLGLLPNLSFAGCAFNSSDLNFGSYQSPYQSTDVLSSNNIILICDLFTLGNRFSIKLQPGQSGNPARRYLTNGKDRLYYNLFLNSSRNTVWGDGTNGSSSYNGVTLLYSRATIFSSVFKNQNVSPGYYSDNISFEISF